MTNPAKHDTASQPELDFLANHKSLLAIRVRPAEFARILGVSKQTVSTWIRDGKVTINALDGLLDVRRAIQDVLRNTSPGRLRSRVLRQAVTDALELRQNLASADGRVAAVEARLEQAHERIAHLDRESDYSDCMEQTIMRLMVEREADFRAAANSEEWADMVSRLEFLAVGICDPLDDDEAAAALTAREAPDTEGGGGDAPTQTEHEVEAR